jgi:hypothetical protein
MTANKLIKLIGCGIAFFGITSLCYSLVMTQNTGNWPDLWPKELEQLRSQARTIKFAAGTQEDIYEISFSDRKQFETFWLVILKVKSPQAPLRLSRLSPKEPNSLLSNAHPVVRIYAPPKDSSSGLRGKEGEAMLALHAAMRDASPDRKKQLDQEIARKWKEQVEQGRILRVGPPWPLGIQTANGTLPEYVCAIENNGKLEWVPANYGDKHVVGFLYRARIEIELVVDGDVIDLNRIPLPADTPIMDKRFAK